MQFLRERRAALGGSLPVAPPEGGAARGARARAFKSQLEGTGEREISTTMAFVRVLAALLRDKQIGTPHRADRPRRVADVRHGGHVPPGRDLLPGRPALPAPGLRAADVLQGGRARPDPRGGDHRGRARSPRSSPPAPPTAPTPCRWCRSTSTTRCSAISGSAIWCGPAADSRTRGFMLGGTAGRTTLNGEGLQHEDGHSHVLFSVVPNCRAYDPTFGYEVAVIIQDGLRRMVAEQEDVFYYLTLMNENYQHPAMPEGAQEGILRGMYLLRDAGSVASARSPRVQLLGSGTILREVLAAAELLEQDFGVLADVWSVTSFTELRRDGHRGRALEHAAPAREEAARRRTSPSGWQARDGPGGRLDRLHPRVRRPDPPVGAAAATRVLGTDGFGRSDYAQRAAALLRGRPPLRRGRRAEGARRRRRGRAGQRRTRRSSATRSTPTAPMPTHRMSATASTYRSRSRTSATSTTSRSSRSWSSPATPSRSRTRCSRSSPTRRRWTCRRRARGRAGELHVKVGDSVSAGRRPADAGAVRATRRSRASRRRACAGLRAELRQRRPQSPAARSSSATPGRPAQTAPPAPTPGASCRRRRASDGQRRCRRSTRARRCAGSRASSGSTCTAWPAAAARAGSPRGRPRRRPPAGQRRAGAVPRRRQLAGSRPAPVAVGRLREVRRRSSASSARGSSGSRRRTWRATG